MKVVFTSALGNYLAVPTRIFYGDYTMYSVPDLSVGPENVKLCSYIHKYE